MRYGQGTGGRGMDRGQGDEVWTGGRGMDRGDEVGTGGTRYGQGGQGGRGRDRGDEVWTGGTR